MKIITNDFKNEITQLGREYQNIIGVYANENDTLLTEESKYILTQNDLLLITGSEAGTIQFELNDDNLYKVDVIQKCNILSSIMKEVDFESDVSLNVGRIIKYKLGIKVNNNYEYIDYGNYIIYKKEFNEDTKTYNYTCYDSMLKTMVSINNREIIENVTISTALTNIANKFGLTITIDNFVLEDYPNLDKTIATNTFKDMDMTYRDVIDMICQACGFNLYVDNNELIFKSVNSNVVDTIDEKFLKDINVTFKEKYGPVNSLVLSRSEDNDNIYEKDDMSISQNGLHEFKIKDNLILNGNDREEYIESIFDNINGLEYYLNDYESSGICYLDLLDFYNVSIEGKEYKCLLLNDEIHIKNGINEKIYTDEPEESVTDYTTSGKSDKEVSFMVDKQNGMIKAKVSKGDVINEINLDESGASINADKISLAGKEIKLTSDDISISSTNFNVNKNGDVTALSLTTGNNVYVGQNQSSIDLTGKGIYFNNNASIRRIITLGNEILAINSGYAVGIAASGSTMATFTSGGINFAVEPTIGSDKRLKNNIKDINNVSWIDELNIKEYEYNDCKDVKRIGLIAQDYENKDYSKYFLDKNEDGYYGIRYNDITNALIQYCQEMKQEIKELKEEIKSLKGDDK